MSTKLKLTSRGKHRRSARFCQLGDCCRKQKDVARIRKKELLSRKTKISVTKLVERNVIDVIKSISGSSNGSDNTQTNKTEDSKLTRTESESSVIYVGTTYLAPNMPRKNSIVDLTKSDTTIPSQWTNTYNLDNYDISGDNILDELHLKDHVSSAASVFTIFPPQPQGLFSSPSDELCVCRTDNPCCVLSIKRNRSTSDVFTSSTSQKPKRVASSKSRLSEKMSSSDCVWKLKKSYPLCNSMCSSKKEVRGSVENINVDINDFNIFDIVEDLEKEFNNISGSQHSALAAELNALKVASMLDSSNVSNLSNV